MNRLNITAKIWLSIAIFVLGYVISTGLQQVQGVSTERTLRTVSQALFPAAQRSQEAEAAFQRVVKGFGDAVLIQDASALDRAVDDGRQVTAGLRAIAAIGGIAEDRAQQARKLASAVEQLVSDARDAYGTVMSNPSAMATMQGRMGDLASRTDSVKTELKQVKERFSQDLQERLRNVEGSSAQHRWVALIVFAATLLLAAVLVNLTIRRAIAGPILRVIDGLQGAAEEAAQASTQVAQSGKLVANDAQQQASYIEETSASLEEIASTTRENANRAGEADRLMREATGTVGRATHAMDELTNSMGVISKSSRQVSDVLKSIDEIAFHTNILALNAAVEAARAGEAGAGFSVVADEVRSLAHRAAEAAKRSAEIIERTISDVANGVQLVSTAHGAFTEVATSITGSSTVVSQIALSSQEQARGVTQIREAISKIEAVTQSNVANAQQTADAAAAMSTQVQATREHLEELVAVVGAHRE